MNANLIVLTQFRLTYTHTVITHTCSIYYDFILERIGPIHKHVWRIGKNPSFVLFDVARLRKCMSVCVQLGCLTMTLYPWEYLPRENIALFHGALPHQISLLRNRILFYKNDSDFHVLRYKFLFRCDLSARAGNFYRCRTRLEGTPFLRSSLDKKSWTWHGGIIILLKVEFIFQQ